MPIIALLQSSYIRALGRHLSGTTFYVIHDLAKTSVQPAFRVASTGGGVHWNLMCLARGVAAHSFAALDLEKSSYSSTGTTTTHPACTASQSSFSLAKTLLAQTPGLPEMRCVPSSPIAGTPRTVARYELRHRV